MTAPHLDLHADPVELTAALVDVPSVSGDEAALADAVEAALRAQTTGYEILRHGNRVLARTDRGLPGRVILAGHLDTVPIADNVPHRRTTEGDDTVLHGCGTVDMKSGDAVFLHLAATVADPAHDLTLVFYDLEEVEATRNGLVWPNGAVAQVFSASDPETLRGPQFDCAWVRVHPLEHI